MKSFFDFGLGTLNFNDANKKHFGIKDAVFSIRFHSGKQQYHEYSNALTFVKKEENVVKDSVFGKSISQTYNAESRQSNLHYVLELLIPDDEAAALWRLSVQNSGEALQIDQLTLLEFQTGSAAGLAFDGQLSKLRFFSQGWQSWSHTASYGVKDRMMTSNLSIAQKPLCYDKSTPRYRQKGKFSGDFFGVISDQSSSEGILLGFLSQREQFGAVSLDMNDLSSLKIWASADGVFLNAGETIISDWAILQYLKVDDSPLDQYTTWVQQVHGVGASAKTHAGWCSWYYFYQDISEPIIRDNLEQIANLRESLPLHLVQIDDGYQQQVGDWLKNAPGFPNGVAPIAESIKERNLLPGLWMAPFIVHPKSDLIHEHPDWILRNKNGKPVNAGFIWNVFTTALDLTHPDALAYAAQVVHEAVEKWGYPYLKLDFLYAAALDGERYDKCLTRAQILRKGYEAIREAVGADIYLLGCGAPIGTSIGYFDAMRIGADVSSSWMPKYFGVEFPFRGEPNMPSARNAIQNVLTRQYMHRKWWINDPDCLLVRPDSELTQTEVQTLTSIIGLSGGAFLVSDNMPELPAERMALIQKVLPIHDFEVDVLDLFSKTVPEMVKVACTTKASEWTVIANYYWQDKIGKVQFSLQDYHLSEGKYWIRSFWNDEIRLVSYDEVIAFPAQPHSAIVLAVRPYDEHKATFLGSNFHILQGIELTKIVSVEGMDKFNLNLNQEMNGFVDLYIHSKVKKILVNANKSNWDEIQENIYRVPIKGNGKIKIRVLHKKNNE
ncbi:MAG: alpha-galactosidase [Anaerolineaceae bacterium]|nr:alpha-galactosidase [Anaerolineaceae bacterium]